MSRTPKEKLFNARHYFESERKLLYKNRDFILKTVRLDAQIKASFELVLNINGYIYIEKFSNTDSLIPKLNNLIKQSMFKIPKNLIKVKFVNDKYKRKIKRR